MDVAAGKFGSNLSIYKHTVQQLHVTCGVSVVESSSAATFVEAQSALMSFNRGNFSESTVWKPSATLQNIGSTSPTMLFVSESKIVRKHVCTKMQQTSLRFRHWHRNLPNQKRINPERLPKFGGIVPSKLFVPTNDAAKSRYTRIHWLAKAFQSIS